MADLDLRTDYKDDILDSSVNEKRKYNIIDNADGTKSLEDVSEYAQRGDSFGAVDINKTNQAVLDLNQSLNDVIENLTVKDFFVKTANNNLSVGRQNSSRVGKRVDLNFVFNCAYTFSQNTNAILFDNDYVADGTYDLAVVGDGVSAKLHLRDGSNVMIANTGDGFPANNNLVVNGTIYVIKFNSSNSHITIIASGITSNRQILFIT